MTLTAIVGALIGVAARPRREPDWLDRLEKLASRVEKLSRSQRKLIEHIEALERELAMERSMSAHWKGEAQRISAYARKSRESYEAQTAAVLYQQACNGPHETSYQGYCNCTPSRAQVWGAQHGLVNQLNRAGG